MNDLDPNNIIAPCGDRPDLIPVADIMESDLISNVFQRLDGVAKKLENIQRQVVKETDLTPPQYFVLTLLWERDGRPFKELAVASHCSPPTITGIVDNLEKKGLVRREPNPDDRRSLLARLTEKGRALQRETPALEEIYRHCCVGLSPEEFRQLGRLLAKLDASLTC